MAEHRYVCMPYIDSVHWTLDGRWAVVVAERFSSVYGPTGYGRTKYEAWMDALRKLRMGNEALTGVEGV